MARTVNCIKLGKEAEGMDFPPYPEDLGKRIWENVSKEAWAAWLKHQTMLVNENRLNLADARARQYLARQMETISSVLARTPPKGTYHQPPELATGSACRPDNLRAPACNAAGFLQRGPISKRGPFWTPSFVTEADSWKHGPPGAPIRSVRACCTTWPLQPVRSALCPTAYIV